MKPGGARPEHWVEINLFVGRKDQDGVLLERLLPFVEGVRREGGLVGFHYFREPEIRFRVRLRTRRERARRRRELAELAEKLVRAGLASRWHFGNHGVKGEEYAGEEDRYGRNGWQVAQLYFNRGSETALQLLALKRREGLENPLWGKGLGNPWEGGTKNPWKEVGDDPLEFHWSRFVHLFSNQLGFDMKKEVELARRQARNYGRVIDETGMGW